MKRRTFGLLAATAALTPTTAAFADPGSGDSSAADAVAAIESDLQSQGTSVADQLALFDQDMADNPDVPAALPEYEAVKASMGSSGDSTEAERAAVRFGPMGPTLAVLAALAWLNAKGYKLAAELLGHARQSHARTSVYSPRNGGRAAESALVQRIGRGSARSGDGSFKNSGSTVDRDMHYAIKKFTWSRTGGNVTIKDVYDFGQNRFPKTFGEIAVTQLVLAQQAGVIHPYHVRFTVYVKR